MTATMVRTFATRDEAGRVWLKHPSSAPEMKPDHYDILDSPTSDLYVFGSERNADLVVRAFTAGRSVYLGSPARDRHREYTARTALLEAQRLDKIPASAGGWHKMQPAELPVYSFVVDWRSGDRRSALETFRDHPARPIAEMCSTAFESCLTEDVSAFVRLVMDPRWFFPSGASSLGDTGKLATYFGLWPASISKLLSMTPESNEVIRTFTVRAMTLIACWSRVPTASVSQSFQKQSRLAASNIYVNHYLENRKKGIEKAILGTCHFFLETAAQSWLDCVSPYELFVPSYCFDAASSDRYRAIRRAMLTPE